jgi:hypothetical protein
VELNHQKKAMGIAAYATFSGSVCMVIGAILLGISGADLDTEIYANDLAKYLDMADAGKTVLLANLSLWILGVILIGAGASMMIYLSEEKPVTSRLALYNYFIGIPIVVVSYMAWVALIVQLAPGGDTDVAIAEVIGWFAVRTDWVATVLVLGTGPLLLSLAGEKNWVPKWLKTWSFLCLLAGILNVLAMYLGGLTSYGFLIIPVGMSWMFAASVVLFRKKAKA